MFLCIRVQRCQPAKFKKGDKAPKYLVKENTGDRYIRRIDRAEGVLVALR